MKRILMLNIFGMEKNNAEVIHFSNLANEFYRLGYDVTIFQVSAVKRFAKRDILLGDITFQEVFVWGRSYILFITFLFAIPKFFKIIKQIRPDVIYLRLGAFSAIYVIILRICMGNSIKILTEHNGWIGPEAKVKGMNAIFVWLGTFLQRYGALYSDRIRAVSSGIKKYLVTLGTPEELIFVVGNGTNTTLFKPIKSHIRWDIGFTGNLARWQGLDWLIKAFALVLKKAPEARLAIVGTGPEEIAIKNLLHKFGIKQNVDMLGDIPYEDVPRIINLYKICVAPKRLFGDPNTPLTPYSYSPLKVRDYAACGKPIIASRIPGLEEIEEAGFGILVPPEGINALADAIVKLLHNPALCKEMGKKARAYAETYYSWELIGRKISEHIEELIHS